MCGLDRPPPLSPPNYGRILSTATHQCKRTHSKHGSRHSLSGTCTAPMRLQRQKRSPVITCSWWSVRKVSHTLVANGVDAL
jgi:hypothetical protein